MTEDDETPPRRRQDDFPAAAVWWCCLSWFVYNTRRRVGGLFLEIGSFGFGIPAVDNFSLSFELAKRAVRVGGKEGEEKKREIRVNEYVPMM